MRRYPPPLLQTSRCDLAAFPPLELADHSRREQEARGDLLAYMARARGGRALSWTITQFPA